MLLSLNIRWIAVAEDLDTDESNPMARFMMHVMSAFAELEREMIRDRTSAGLRSYCEAYTKGRLGFGRAFKSGFSQSKRIAIASVPETPNFWDGAHRLGRLQSSQITRFLSLIFNHLRAGLLVFTMMCDLRKLYERAGLVSHFVPRPQVARIPVVTSAGTAEPLHGIPGRPLIARRQPPPDRTPWSHSGRITSDLRVLKQHSGALTPLANNSLAPEWEIRQRELRSKWEANPASTEIPGGTAAGPPRAECRATELDGELFDVEFEPSSTEKVYVLRPRNAGGGPLPVLIVPFYDVDIPAAEDLGGRSSAPGGSVNTFAYTAAQHGFIAVAVRWFGESYGESYSEAIANLALRHPGATGLGKWVADARRLVDFIGTLPDADSDAHRNHGPFARRQDGALCGGHGASHPRRRGVRAWRRIADVQLRRLLVSRRRVPKLPAGTDQHELIGFWRQDLSC